MCEGSGGEIRLDKGFLPVVPGSIHQSRLDQRQDMSPSYLREQELLLLLLLITFDSIEMKRPSLEIN